MKALKNKLISIMKSLRNTLIAVLIGLVVGAVIIWICGENVFNVYWILLKGAFGNLSFLTSTLTMAGPIILTGLAVSVAWRCGYLNLGMEGQMILGGLTAAILAVHFPGSGFIKIVVSFIGAIVAGGLYSVLAAWLYRKFEASIIITTLMLNYIAKFISNYIVQYEVLDPFLPANTAAIQTQQIPDAAHLPKLFSQYNIHLGFIIAIVAVIIMYLVMKKTRFGYQSKMSGLNPIFADYGGINRKRLLYFTMFLSGAIVAFAGAIEVLGLRFRYFDNMFGSSGYVWTGVTATLMASHNPIGLFFSSIFLSAISTGSASVQRNTSIPVEVALMIQGTITLFITVQFIVKHIRKKKSSKILEEGAVRDEL